MSVTKLVDVDTRANFIQESNQVAFHFLNLYLAGPSDRAAKEASTARSPAPERKIAEDSSHSEESIISSGPPEPALLIARKLKEIGDQIDEKVKKQLEEAFAQELQKGVFQIGREQFRRMCQTVLSTCAQSLQNGWQQATVVYMGMASMVGELRRHQDAGQREPVVQNIASETLQVLGLDDWIQQHGGFENFGQPVEGQNNLVPIEGTSVDA